MTRRRLPLPLPGHRVWILTLAWLLSATLPGGSEVEGRRDVAVLYNSQLPASRDVAEHYAARRGIPTNHCIGLDLPTTEAISREDYESRMERPLLAELKARDLIQTRLDLRPATEDAPGRIAEVLLATGLRYLVVCHGVPLRITEQAGRAEKLAANLPEALRRNRAAVDAELTVFPLLLSEVPRVGPIANRWFGATNAADLHPMNGVFVVGRLDGPTPEISRALVDRALEAEENGLLGRGYFDLRASTDPVYQNGDRWISNAWAVVTRYGYDTSIDTTPATLPASFPLSHVAFYAGWYDAHVSGPFAAPAVEFMPGAIAYHLHSYSAATLRSTNQHWVGPLVARGVTATMGTVDEPYLDGTPDVGLCFARLLYSGFTWGEAVLVSQKMLSWQLTVVGDPLYCPFSMNALERAKDLARRGQGRMDWALVTLYNRKLQASGDVKGIIDELAKEPRARLSPVLQEKLGDLYLKAADPAAAAEAFRRATRWGPSLHQRNRLLLQAARAYEEAGRIPQAYEAYEDLVRTTPAPPDAPKVFQRLLDLATTLGNDSDATRWTEQLERLKNPAAPAR